jgi:hypothetical protein
MSDEVKKWWQTLPAIITGIATLLTAVTGLVVTLHQWGFFTPSEKKRAPSASPAFRYTEPLENKPLEEKQPVLSTNIDEPTLLTSNEIRGNGVGEDISYYCTFSAGPGTVTVTLHGKNKPGLLAIRPGDFSDAVAVEVSDFDANPLVYIATGNTNIDKQKIAHFQLGHRQQVKMRISLSKHTLDYMVRVGGPIDLSPASNGSGPQ